jgi:hypothetical protein
LTDAAIATSATPIGQLLEDYAARGVFRVAADRPKNNRDCYQIVWFREQEMQLEIDARHRKISLINVLPTIVPRSRLDRQLRSWLRQREAADLPAHRRLDPDVFQLKFGQRDGVMVLSLTSTGADLLPATRKLVELVNELYLDFLGAAERFDWIQEAFELDPDNPRWP